MGFFSELQMELDDYEVISGRRPDCFLIERCTKKVHFERRLNELAWYVMHMEPGKTWSKKQVLKHCLEIRSIVDPIGWVSKSA